MKTIIIALFPLLISITVAVPIKNPNDLDDILARMSYRHLVNEYFVDAPRDEAFNGKNWNKNYATNKKNNGPSLGGTLDSIGGGLILVSVPARDTLDQIGGGNLNGKRAPLDLERSPLLYDYYSSSPNTYHPRQSLDHLDKDILDHYLALRAMYASGFTEPVKREFDEIDRDPEDQLKGGIKRNIDEIDRAGFNALKRNFDEIDRAGFNGLKRTGAYYNEIERPGVSFNSKHTV